MADVHVLVEHSRGNVADITYELLNAGRAVADALHAPLKAILLAKELSALAPQLGFADGIIAMAHETLDDPNTEAWSQALITIVEEKKPDVLLIGNTNALMGLASVVSERANLPLIGLCRSLRVEDHHVIGNPLLYGGKIEAEVRATRMPVVIAVQPGSYPAESAKVQRTAPMETVTAPVTLEKVRVKFKRYVELERKDVDITQCEVLVSVGRGIQSKDNIGQAQELAGFFRNAAVSASRPVIDHDWLPMTRQVGKSGMTVKPRLYLALGISGAPEHQEGMKNSGTIVAVNTDPKAPIFNIADYGVVADVLDLLPPLIDQLKKRKAGA